MLASGRKVKHASLSTSGQEGSAKIKGTVQGVPKANNAEASAEGAETTTAETCAASVEEKRKRVELLQKRVDEANNNGRGGLKVAGVGVSLLLFVYRKEVYTAAAGFIGLVTTTAVGAWPVAIALVVLVFAVLLVAYFKRDAIVRFLLQKAWGLFGRVVDASAVVACRFIVQPIMRAAGFSGLSVNNTCVSIKSFARSTAGRLCALGLLLLILFLLWMAYRWLF